MGKIDSKSARCTAQGVAAVLADPRMRSELDTPTANWSKAILRRYLEISVSNENLQTIRAQAAPLLNGGHGPRIEPYRADARPPVAVSYDDLLRLAIRRRSVRIFLNRSVPLADIQQAMAVAVQAPSACNRQAYCFRAFYDRSDIEAIAGAATGVRSIFIPVLILVTAQYRGYADERDILSPIVDSAQALMAFQLALETLGLSSLCINWPVDRQSNERLRSAISLDVDEQVVMRLAVGYADPAGLIATSEKRHPSQLLRSKMSSPPVGS